MKKKKMSKFLLMATILGCISLSGCGMKSNKTTISDLSETITDTVDDSKNNNESEKSTESMNDSSTNSTESTINSFYEVKFELDSHVKVYIYETQDFTLDYVESTVGYSRDSDTGELLGDGNGQINFKLEFDDGYEIDSINVSGSYKNIKGSADTGVTNGYRITKIASDLIVTITSKEITQEEDVTDGFKATFNLENCSVYAYLTQDTSTDGIDVSNNDIYARDSLTGNILTDGSGQINFKVVPDEGYQVNLANITVTGTYNNIKAIDTNIFRITKISSDITINVSAAIIDDSNDTLTSLQIITYNDNNEYTLNVNATSSFSYTYENDLLIINSDYENTYTLDGIYYGAIKFNSLVDINLELNNVSIYSNDLCPLYIETEGNSEISAKSNTINNIIDNRDEVPSESETDVSGALYTTCDLKLKGTGTLNIESKNNNGIHSKDDLEIQKLTLNVNVCDNAIKGNDSVTINSCHLELISKKGDGIKTSNTALNSSNEQKGTITINEGEINIYSACDGIDAAYDTIINGGIINIYTDKYSTYSEEVSSVSDSIYYIRSTSTSYKYSIYYYNSNTNEYVWKNSNTTYDTTQTIQQGPKRTTYYFYEIDKPEGYDSMIIYVYNSTQTQGNNTSYYTKSSSMTINNSYDTINYSGTQFSWTTYQIQQQGGMNQGNSNKLDYSAKGIKASNTINITNGTLNIKSYDDSLHANNDNELESGATPLGNINISGGDITLTSNDDGIHADYTLNITGGNINILTAYEGIEGNQIYFDGGNVYVYSTDDAVNAATCNSKTTPCIYMKSGYVDLDCPSGDTDTLDSNGNIVMTGGILVVKNRQSASTSMTGGTIDLDGQFNMTGGLLVSFGTWCNEVSISAIKSSTSTVSSGTYTLYDSNNNQIFETTLKTNYTGYRIISKLSGSYKLLKDGSSFVTF